jgi:hypothetical protein
VAIVANSLGAASAELIGAPFGGGHIGAIGVNLAILARVRILSRRTRAS